MIRWLWHVWVSPQDLTTNLTKTSPFQMRWTRSSVDLLMLLLAVQRKLSMLTITKKTGQTKTIQITLFTARFTVHKTIEEWIRYHVHPNAVLLSIAKLRFQNTSWLHKDRIPAIRSWIKLPPKCYLLPCHDGIQRCFFIFDIFKWQRSLRLTILGITLP